MITIRKTAHVTRSGGDYRSQSPSYITYEGRINGKAFSVDVDEMSAPSWAAGVLSEDDRNEILIAIEEGVQDV